MPSHLQKCQNQKKRHKSPLIHNNIHHSYPPCRKLRRCEEHISNMKIIKSIPLFASLLLSLDQFASASVRGEHVGQKQNFDRLRGTRALHKSSSSKSKSARSKGLQEESQGGDIESSVEPPLDGRTDEEDEEGVDDPIDGREDSSVVGRQDRFTQEYKYVLQTTDYAVQDSFNVFKGNLMNETNGIEGTGLVYCTKASQSLPGICWLEYNIDDVEGYGPGTLTAFGSLPLAPPEGEGPVKMTLTVTGVRGDFLNTEKTGGWLEIFLSQVDGPETSLLYSKIVLTEF